MFVMVESQTIDNTATGSSNVYLPQFTRTALIFHRLSPPIRQLCTPYYYFTFYENIKLNYLVL
jgi:hypothetical protein